MDNRSRARSLISPCCSIWFVLVLISNHWMASLPVNGLSTVWAAHNSPPTWTAVPVKLLLSASSWAPVPLAVPVICTVGPVVKAQRPPADGPRPAASYRSFHRPKRPPKWQAR